MKLKERGVSYFTWYGTLLLVAYLFRDALAMLLWWYNVGRPNG